MPTGFSVSTTSDFQISFSLLAVMSSCVSQHRLLLTNIFSRVFNSQSSVISFAFSCFASYIASRPCGQPLWHFTDLLHFFGKVTTSLFCRQGQPAYFQKPSLADCNKIKRSGTFRCLFNEDLSRIIYQQNTRFWISNWSDWLRGVSTP